WQGRGYWRASKAARPRRSSGGHFAEQGPDVVQNEIRAEESHAVDVADAVLAVQQKDLEDVPEEPAPPAVREAQLGHRLAEVFEQRPQVVLATRGEEPPRRGR